MRRCILAVTIFAATTALTGCRSHQLANDQSQFRQVLLGMYEDQLMDNLIRAKNRMPLLHLDYTNITGTVTDTGSANVGGGPIGGTRTTTFAPVAATRSLARMATTAFNYGVSASQINQLTVTANPIVDNSAVYLAYLNFVEQPGRLLRTCAPPPAGAAHVVRQCGNLFYWVPIQYRDEFLEVALRTTGVRSDPSTAPLFYTVNVTGYLDHKPSRTLPGEPQTYFITFRVDTPLPNDTGWMTAVVEGRECKFRLRKTVRADGPKDDQAKDKTKEQAGADTQTLKLQYAYIANTPPGPVKDSDVSSAPFAPDVIAKALANQAVKVQLDNHQPVAPAMDDTLGSIRTQAELLRLNQLQLLNK